jgi:hypothetical protein
MLRRALLASSLVLVTLIAPAAPAYAAPAPLNCRLNGNKCDGSADRPPNAPGGLAVAGRTTKRAEFRRQMDELTTTSGKRYLLTAFTPAETVKIAAGWHIGATEFSATWTSPRCRATTSTTLHNGL